MLVVAVVHDHVVVVTVAMVHGHVAVAVVVTVAVVYCHRYQEQ